MGRATIPLGGVLAIYALGIGLLALAYQAYGYLHEGYWPTLAIGSVWDRLGEQRPWFQARELQMLLEWLLDLPLSTTCFGLSGLWLFWQTTFRHLCSWTD